VRIQQGGIRVKDSVLGVGTSIELRLPTTQAPANTASRSPPVQASHRHRVLWVDDEPAIRTLARSYLTALKCSGDVAASAAEALSLLEANDYTVVITDVGMPGMTGLELAERIQALPDLQVPVIALTGWGDTIKEGDAPPDGILQVLAKPVHLEKLRGVLNGLAPLA
jgi:CheY-like chemotaxis protein